MAKLSIQFKSDFSMPAIIAAWYVLSVTPGIMVWVLGMPVSYWDLFPAPMTRSVIYPGPAYASVVASLVFGVIATFYLSKIIIISGLNFFCRALALASSIACIVFLGTMNPFDQAGYASKIATQVLAIGDWVFIAALGTVTGFLFSLSLTIGISRKR
jgi:hypothetical protein